MRSFRAEVRLDWIRNNRRTLRESLTATQPLNCFNLVQHAQLLRRQALVPFLSISSFYGWFKENTCCLVDLPIMVLTSQGGEGAWALPYLALPFEFASLLREWIGVDGSAMISGIYKSARCHCWVFFYYLHSILCGSSYFTSTWV